MSHRLWVIAALVAAGCGESAKSSALTMVDRQGICRAPLDTSDCFAVLVMKQDGDYRQKLVEVAKCTFEGEAQGGSISKDPAGIVDLHCESTDGELVVDVHLEGLARRWSGGDDHYLQLALPERSWMRLRATGEAAARFPEVAGESVERMYTGEAMELFGGALKQPGDFVCDSDGDGVEDAELGCPPLPRRAQGDWVFWNDFGLNDEPTGHDTELSIGVSYLLSLPGLPIGCTTPQGHPRPCED